MSSKSRVDARAKEFQYHVKRFLSWYLPIVLSCSKHTIRSYRQAFKLFFEYLNDQGVKPHKIDLGHINADCITQFLLWLEDERENSPGSRNARLAAFRSFCNYLEFQAPELLEECAGVLCIKTKKVPRKSLQYLSPEAIKAILEEALLSSMRDYVLLQLLYDSAARVSEIASLSIGSFHFRDQDKEGAPSQVRIVGKGNKARTVFISKQTTANLRRYLKANEEHLGKGTGIFLSQRGGGLTRDGIAGVLGKHVASARKKHPQLFPSWSITPHTLRHSRATHWLAEGLTLEQVRDLLGHRFIATTEIYAEVLQEDIRKAVEAMNEKVLSGSNYEIDNCEDLDDWFNHVFSL